MRLCYNIMLLFRISTVLDPRADSREVKTTEGHGVKVQALATDRVVLMGLETSRLGRDSKVVPREVRVGLKEVPVGPKEAMVGPKEAKVDHREAKVGHREAMVGRVALVLRVTNVRIILEVDHMMASQG